MTFLVWRLLAQLHGEEEGRGQEDPETFKEEATVPSISLVLQPLQGSGACVISISGHTISPTLTVTSCKGVVPEIS